MRSATTPRTRPPVVCTTLDGDEPRMSCPNARASALSTKTADVVIEADRMKDRRVMDISNSGVGPRASLKKDSATSSDPQAVFRLCEMSERSPLLLYSAPKWFVLRGICDEQGLAPTHACGCASADRGSRSGRRPGRLFGRMGAPVS